MGRWVGEMMLVLEVGRCALDGEEVLGVYKIKQDTNLQSVIIYSQLKELLEVCSTRDV